MRMQVVFLVVMAFSAGCRVVSDEGGGFGPPVPRRASPFQTVDSLMQTGLQDAAVRGLRALWSDMGSPVSLRGDFLWRFTGCYNGRGMPDRCISVLDSLSARGWGDVTGWKISVMELNRMGDAAVALAGDDDLLRAWLMRGTPGEMPRITLPAPEGPAERTVRVLLADPGSLTPAQIAAAAQDAQLFPSTLAARVRSELRTTISGSGEWWDSALKLLDPDLSTQGGAELNAGRMRARGEGSREDWLALLDSPGARLTAAQVIASKYPEDVDWRVVDILYEGGSGSLVTPIAAARGGEFASAVEMAKLRASGRNTDLLSYCAAIPAGSSEQLRGRAALFRARALRSLNRNADAWAAYTHFASSFPWHPTAPEAGYLAGVYYDCEQQWGAAADAYLAGLRAAGTFDADERGHWRAGFCLYMNGRGAVGDSLWAVATERWPYGYWRDEMLFWRARYANRKGNGQLEASLLARVAREHPWEYYGMLAAERLGIRSPITLTVYSPVLADNPETALAISLFENGYGTLAVEMLTAGAGDRGRRAAALGLLGQHGSSIGMMRSWDTELRDRNMGMLPDSILGWYFPGPYHDQIVSAVRDLSVEPYWIEGIARDESYFNRFAQSGVGASGLIQLMPGTAGDVARWSGLPRLSGNDFFVPEYSLRYGSIYVNRQMNSFGHSPLFLAAYNAGPGNASRWVNTHGWDPGDPELFIEQITFRETRLYVKNVQRSVWIYERMRR